MPQQIKKIFNLLILYTNFYIRVCNTIFGGFLDVPKFSSIEKEYEAQIELQAILQAKKNLIMPFWNFWPKY